jgi:hypothetical protein
LPEQSEFRESTSVINYVSRRELKDDFSFSFEKKSDKKRRSIIGSSFLGCQMLNHGNLIEVEG